MLSLGNPQVLPLAPHKVVGEELLRTAGRYAVSLEYVFKSDSPSEKCTFFLYIAQHTVTFETGTDLRMVGKLPTSQEQGHTGEERSHRPK